MNIHDSKRSRRNRFLRLSGILSFGAIFFAFEASPIYAIPSPDVVMNVVTGAAQGLVILGAALASVAVAFFRALKQPTKTLARVGPALVVGALVASLSFNYFQHHNHEADTAQRLNRNLARKSMQNGKVVRDTSLKVLSRSDQLTHPLGLTTEQLSKRLLDSNPPRMIDVREPEELAMGTIQGVEHERYPDLRRNFKGSLGSSDELLLLCYSGNRSGELAEIFSEEFAVEVRFMVGGYEKWIQEKRPMDRETDGMAQRDILPYPAKDRLLDTPEVEKIYQNQEVVFIDTRYPEEFEAFHLPNSVNIPLRMMLEEDIEKALQELPVDKAYIGVCFDKRSSFYAKIIGSKITSRAHMWLGRYSLPYEFSEPAKVTVEGSKESIFVVWISSLLAVLSGWFGSIGVSIIALVLALRLLLLPLSVAAEASQQSPKEKKALSSEQKGRPFLSLCSGLALAAVFIGVAASLNATSSLSGMSFLWLGDFLKPDPLLILPALIAVIAFVQMSLGGKFNSRKGKIAVVGFAILFFWLTIGLKSAINLAIVVNLGVSACLSGYFWWKRQARQVTQCPTRQATRIVPLFRADRFTGIGPKASRLSTLKKAGLRVPDGFVIPQSVIELGLEDRELLKAFDALDAGQVAVRSAGIGEDGAEKSFAGIFESILYIQRPEIVDAVKIVTQSFDSAKAHAYSKEEEAAPCILVQEMIDADYAGVVFTRHPNHPAEIAVEYVEGCGEKLVSGHAAPERFTVGRVSRALIEGEESSIDIPWQELVRIAMKCEDTLGGPQDIEWAYKDGILYVLQSRDITASAIAKDSESARLESERERLINVVRNSDVTSSLCREGVCELVDAPTPASLSLIKALLGPTGASSLARRQLGIPYKGEFVDRALELVYGRLRLNTHWTSKLFPSPSKIRILLTSIRLHRKRSSFNEDWAGSLFKEIRRECRVEGSRDLNSLKLDEIADLLEGRVKTFSQEHYPKVELLNLVTAYQESLVSALLKKEGLPESTLARVQTESKTSEGEKLLRSVALGDATLEQYLDEFGHRSTVDYELSCPRFSEDPTPVQSMVQALTGAAKRPTHSIKSSRESETNNPAQSPRLEREIAEFCRLASLKESARHEVLRSLELVREGMNALGRNSGLFEHIFQLTIDEMLLMARGETANKYGVSYIQLAACRHREREIFFSQEGVEDVDSFSVEDLECIGRGVAKPQDEGALCGVCVCGNEPVEGRVRIFDADDVHFELRADEILVARSTDTSMAPLFGMARGLVTEVGGLLSHAAIVAREMSLPTIVGARQVTRRLKNGDRIRMEPDGSIQLIPSVVRTTAVPTRAAM